MKKLFSVIIVLAIIATLCLCACKPEEEKPVIHDVKIVCPTLSVKVGEQPDFAGNVKVTVDGEEVVGADVKAVLKSGDVTVAGRCVYTLSFTYEEQTYTASAYVNFEAKTVTPPNQEPTDKEESAKFNAILAKNPTSFTFGYKYEVPEDNSVIDEKEKYDNGKYSVEYSEHIEEPVQGGTPTVTENEIGYYLQSADETFTLYFKSETDGKWYYRTLDETSENDYSFWPYAFLVSEYDWDYMMFEKNADNFYKVKDAYFTTVTGDVFGSQEATREIKTITLKTDGENVTELYFEYTETDSNETEYLAKVTYTWNSFGNTSVTLPEAEKYVIKAEKPDFINPTQNALPAEDAEKLTAAFAKTYGNLRYGFTVDKGNYYSYTTMIGALDGNKAYTFYDEHFQVYDMEIPIDSWEFYYKYNSDTKTDLYHMSDGEFIYQSATGSFTEWFNSDYGAYYAVKDIALTADLFGKEGEVYVVKSDKLTQLYTLLDAAFKFSADTDLTQQTLATCQITLDGSNNVTRLYIVLHAFNNSREVYAQFDFKYSDFGSVTLHMPNETDLQALTPEQLTSLQQALSKDFSNVTLTEPSSQNVYKYVGNDIYAEVYYEENSKQSVHYRYDTQNGKWLKVLGEVTEDADMDTFKLEVIKFDFGAITDLLSTFQFNNIDGTYYLANPTQQTLDSLVFYYSNFADLYNDNDDGVTFGGFKALTIELKDNYISRITLVADELSVSVTFGDYGKTTAE